MNYKKTDKAKISPTEYKATRHLEADRLKTLSPLHFIEKVKKATEQYYLREAINLAIMDKEVFNRMYTALLSHTLPNPDKNFTNAKNKEFKDRFMERAGEAGKEVLSEKDFHTVGSILDKIELDIPQFDQFVSGGVSDISYFALYDPELSKFIRYRDRDESIPIKGNYLPCKARLSFVKDSSSDSPYVIMVKATLDGSPRGFSRDIEKFEHDLDIAFAMDIVSCVEEVEYSRAFFLSTETNSPYAVQIYSASEDVLNIGRLVYKKRLDTLFECSQRESYPSYWALDSSNTTTVLDIDLPEYAKTQRLLNDKW